MTKVFIPRRAGWTKRAIWDYFYVDNVGKRYLPVIDDGDEYIIPEFTPDQIPDNICQAFVNQIDEIDAEYEEDRVDMQREIAVKFYPKIITAIKKTSS